jgi:uncharacterized protein (TIGR02594 family)
MLVEASRHVSEIAGPGASADIVKYHARTKYHATSDEIAWCSSCMCFCVEEGGFESTQSAAAASWLQWGYALPAPRFGAVTVLLRPGGHHVGIYLGEEDGFISLLGGNQRNTICASRFPKTDVMRDGYRWKDRQSA